MKALYNMFEEFTNLRTHQGSQDSSRMTHSEFIAWLNKSASRWDALGHVKHGDLVRAKAKRLKLQKDCPVCQLAMIVD